MAARKLIGVHLVTLTDAAAAEAAPVLGGDPEMAERFRLLKEADERRAERMRIEADQVAASVTTRAPGDPPEPTGLN